MTIAGALAIAITIPVAIPLAILCLELGAGLLFPRRAATAAGPVPRTTILIPAHDEGLGIAGTLAALAPAREAGCDILVVADNCSDDTAAIARRLGARVVERQDAERRGKGFALAFGRSTLADDPPACVIILDADCRMAADDLVRLSTTCVAEGRAMQARNLQLPRSDQSPATAVSSFAFLVKNHVRQLGAMRMGRVAILTGTGMALPWKAFADAPLATADLTEDLALGVWLTANGQAPRYCDAATVWSEAASGGALVAQRSRWELGFIDTARRTALPALARGMRAGSRSRIWLALHLMVPPLALLIAAAGLALVLATGLALIGGGWLPAVVLLALLIAVSAGVGLAWHRYGRDYLDARALRAIPGYIAMKLPLYRRLGRARTIGWQRTRRPGED